MPRSIPDARVWSKHLAAWHVAPTTDAKARVVFPLAGLFSSTDGWFCDHHDLCFRNVYWRQLCLLASTVFGGFGGFNEHGGRSARPEEADVCSESFLPFGHAMGGTGSANFCIPSKPPGICGLASVCQSLIQGCEQKFCIAMRDSLSCLRCVLLSRSG